MERKMFVDKETIMAGKLHLQHLGSFDSCDS